MKNPEETPLLSGEFECPECKFEGTEIDFDIEVGLIICPECGTKFQI